MSFEPRMPGVSVIIPTFNGASYLADALISVLNQSHPAREIIVVDDGSTDASRDIASRFTPAVRLVLQPNRGTANARNHGVHLARGNYLAFLDQDDIWESDKLKRQLTLLAEQSAVDMVFGHMQHFHSPDLPPGLKARLLCPEEPLPGYTPSALLLRRGAFDRVGFFCEDLCIGEWMDWLSRAKDLGILMHMLPDLVGRRRIHAKNKGVTQRHNRGEYLRIFKDSLDRRRSPKDS